MKFEFGADVVTFDGEKIGTVKRAVIDPASQEITHFIIEKGFLFTKDKVLPISMVLRSEEDQIKLVETDEDLEDLPDYRQDEFFPVEDPDTPRPDPTLSRPFLAIKPQIVPQSQPGHMRIVRKEDYHKNIPEHTELLEVGADVCTLDGEDVGNIQEMITDPKTHQIRHLVIGRGWLEDKEVLIPMDWIKEISTDQVELTVDRKVIQNLPPHLEEEA